MSQKKLSAAEERVVELKAKYPDHCIIEFEDGKVAVFSKPERAVVGLMALNNRDRGPLSAVDTILKNCWVDGDDVVKTDPGYAIGLMAYIDAICGTKLAELKN